MWNLVPGRNVASEYNISNNDGLFRREQVTCEAGKLPERFRAVARVLLQSCDGHGVSFGSEYVAIRAEIQEPTVRIKLLCTSGVHLLFLRTPRLKSSCTIDTPPNKWNVRNRQLACSTRRSIPWSAVGT